MKRYTGPMLSILILGLTTACASHRMMNWMENDTLKAAKAELREVDQALRMYQAASPDTAFPEECQIKSYLDLRTVLQPYVKLPEESDIHWSFMSYTRPSPGVYMIVAMQEQPPIFRFMTIENGGEPVYSNQRRLPKNFSTHPPPE